MHRIPLNFPISATEALLVPGRIPKMQIKRLNVWKLRPKTQWPHWAKTKMQLYPIHLTPQLLDNPISFNPRLKSSNPKTPKPRFSQNFSTTPSDKDLKASRRRPKILIFFIFMQHNPIRQRPKSMPQKPQNPRFLHIYAAQPHPTKTFKSPDADAPKILIFEFSKDNPDAEAPKSTYLSFLKSSQSNADTPKSLFWPLGVA